MNAAQQGMYWAEWGKAWKALLRLGRKSPDRETERKRFHLRIGAVDRRGQPLSSRFLSNRHLDRFLALCKSYSDPASLQAQLDLDAQPERRALVACEPLLDELGMAHEHRAAYIAGIYRNVQRSRPQIRDLHDMPDEDLGIVIAALGHTVRHKLGVEHRHPSARNRARDDHRVGARRAPDSEPPPAERPAAAPVQEPADAEGFF